MKWSDEQTAKLRELCFAEVPNAGIAKQLGVPVREIHAKRSQLGITIPKVLAAKGKPAITANPEFEKAVQDMEKSIHKRLPSGVREAFKRLQDELLLAMARNDTNPEEAKMYGRMSDIVSAMQECFTRWIQEAE